MPKEMPEKCETLEELRWAPGVPDCDLMMYLRAARSMAAFAGMCDGGSAEDGCLAASRDDTTINALELLHESNYDTGKALQALVKSPIPKGIDKKWSEEETKRFVKGLRQYGKNFFKIRRELLSHKETADLVEFYYLWKKTPQAATTRPHRRHRRQCVLRRIRASSSTGTPKNVNSNLNTAPTTDLMDMSSASDDDESDDSDSREIGGNVCNNCLATSSKEWHQNNGVGKESTLLCNECKNFHKKFGELPKQMTNSTQVTNPAPCQPSAPQIIPPSLPSPAQQTTQFVFKSEDESISNGKHNMRTRRSKDKTKDSNRSNIKSEPNSPERNEPIINNDRKSPTIPNCSEISSKSEAKYANESIPKKRIASDISESDEINDEINIKQKKSNSDENHIQESCPQELDTETNTVLCNEDNDLKDNESEETNAEIIGSAESSIISQSESAQNEPKEKNVDKPETDTDSSVSNEPMIENVQNDSEDNKLNIASLIAKEEVVNNEAKDIPILNAEPKSPSKLITPKLEPPSSPKSPSNYNITSLVSHISDNTSQVSLNQKTSISSTPPLMRIKEELNYPKSPPQSHSAQVFSGLGVDSPLNDRVFPYIASQPLGTIPHRMTTSPIPHNSSIELSGSDSLKDVMTNPNEVSFVQKGAKDHSSSSKSSYTSTHTSIRKSPNIAIPITSSISSADSLFQSSYSSQITPSEQRLPAVSASATHPNNHFANIQSHASMMSPTLSPHMMHPSMSSIPPYFPTSWSPYSSRCLPPPHLGFQSSPFAPPMMNTGPQMHSSSREMSVSKSKSPISSQSSRVSHSPSQYTGHHHSKHESKYDLNSVSNRDVERHRDRDHPHEEEELEPTPILTRGPSPEPKIEDSECHRSQSAIFLRHWNRGDYNSCARTDLTFKPVPDSQLARKREERARKAAEKEREEQKKIAAEKALSLEMKSSLLNHSNMESNSHMSPLGRHTPRNFADTPALRQLSEYARPHAAFSPVYSHPSMHGMVGSGNIPLGMHQSGAAPGIEQLLQYQIASGLYGNARDRMAEAEEREKRERQMLMEKQRELKELEMKSRMASHGSATPIPPSGNLLDPHWLELQRRYASQMHSGNSAVNPGSGQNQMSPFVFYSGDRQTGEQMHGLSAAERMHVDRLAMASNDPLYRLQMAGLSQELHSHAHNHAHAHQHTHLHVHPGHDAVQAAAQAAANAIGLPSNPHTSPQFDPQMHSNHPLLPSNSFGGRAPSIMGRNDLQSSQLFRSSFDEQLAHQLSAQALHHEQLQRQLIMERERMVAAHLTAAAGGQMQGPHPSLLSQHEADFLRQQQRERELKLRSLEEAARGGRPPLS